MADPQSPVGWVVSTNKGNENDISSSSYESPSDPSLSVKMKRSSGPQDEDYISEEDVYEHEELNILINFKSIVLLMTIFTPFLESPSMSKCLKFVSSAG
jgi:hypothetical protein